MTNIKVIISSFGSLFFNQTVKYLRDKVHIVYIQDSVPDRITAWLIKSNPFINKIKKIQTILEKRDPELLPFMKSCGPIEITYKVFRSIFGITDFLQHLSLLCFGYSSKLFIGNADVFHVRSGSGRGGAISKARRCGMIIITDHSIAHPFEIESILKPEYERNKTKFEYNPKSRFWTDITKDCIEADLLLVNSEYVKQTFIKYGYNKEFIKVLYLGVRNDFIMSRYDYKRNSIFQILFVGGFNIRKGCEYILKALNILSVKKIPYKLIVIGTYGGFESVLNHYNTENIEFVGYVMYDELKKYYQKSDVFLFPSLCEGSTRVGMEAMAAGLPVVVTENCGMPVINGENGIIVPIKDEQAIAESIEKLYFSEELRKKIGTNAYNTINENFRWEKYAENLLDIYKDCKKTYS